MTRGRFIVLEGIDGSGTTTQAKRLTEELARRGRSVVATWEPSTGPVGQLIRRALRHELARDDGGQRELSWETLALLFAADRADHVESVIRPALDAGLIVVSDRYDLSSLTYQSLTAPEPDGALAWIRTLNARAVRPDLTLVLDVAGDVAEVRRASRGGPAELFEVTELQRRLAALYTRAERLVPADRLVHVVDGEPDVVFGAVLRSVLEII